MLPNKLLSGVKRLLGAEDTSSQAKKRAAEAMQTVLDRERSRADRTGSEFSMLTFSTAGEESGKPKTLGLLAEFLKYRSRSIDDVGWAGDRQVWFVLPNCPADAAAKVANEICDKFQAEGLPLEYKAFHHKSQSAEDSSRGNDQRGNDQHGNDDSRWSGLPAMPVLQDAQDLPTEQAPGSNQSVQPMEPLYLRRTLAWKRAIDVIGAGGGLIVLTPILATAAVAVRLTSPGPVFFKQRRSGRGGVPFWIYKFRSMVADAEARKAELMSLNEQDGPAFKIEHDPRVTTVGRILRSTSIDELPQLWNVLKGEMSLVGPRPLPCEESEACSGWYLERLNVTPGLTCFWQVKDRRSKISFADWARMDIRYIRRRSLWLDLKLIVQTIICTLRRTGM